MNQTSEADLMLELAKLLKKHGPEPFEYLSKSMSNPETVQQFSVLLAQLANIGRSVSANKTAGKTQNGDRSVSRLLGGLKMTDHPKYEILVAFRDGFVNRSLLPTLRDVREFASRWGLSDVHVASRDKPLGPLMLALSSLTREEIVLRLQSAPTATIDDHGLSGWSRLILDRQRQPKT